MDAVWQAIFGAVGEFVALARGNDSGPEEIADHGVEADFAQADDHAETREQGHFFVEPVGAVALLFEAGFVVWRGAADGGADPHVFKAQAVFAALGIGLRGEAGFIEDGKHEVSGAVAGEGAAGAVGAVRSGGKAHDQDARFLVAEGWNWAAPVVPVAPLSSLVAGDLSAVCAEAGAAFAGDDLGVQDFQCCGGDHPHIVRARAESAIAPSALL